MTVELCRPVEAHARQVMDWRNDPHTLAMFFHREPKTWESFWPEFRDTYFTDPGLPPLFARAGDQRVAFLRFQPCAHPEGRGRAVDISVNVAPEHRGKGFGVAAIRAGLDYLADTSGYDGVLAEVRAENHGSHKAFLGAGFRKLDEAVHHVEDTGEDCPVVRYVFDLTPSGWTSTGVFVIAEAGSNWRMGNDKRDRAMGRALIDVAVVAGADAVKFQTYRPETVYVENAGSSAYLAENGIDEDIRDIFADLAMPYELVGDLADYSRQCGIAFMSTPFSEQDFAAIDPHVDRHKIASYEISHPALIDLAAASGKPTLMSTGAATEDDISWAVDRYRAAGGRDLCLLQCTAKYPAPLASLNLRTLAWLKRRYHCAVGLSDHSRHPTMAPLAAAAMGARVIEKHYTLDNRLPGPDHAFAVTPGELAEMVRGIRAVEETLGDGVKRVQPDEQELRAFAQRRLQATRPVKAGEPLREGENFAVLRPGQQRPGVHPRHLPEVENRPAARDIPVGDGIQFGDWQ